MRLVLSSEGATRTSQAEEYQRGGARDPPASPYVLQAGREEPWGREADAEDEEGG